jgi:hypothetical protein
LRVREHALASSKGLPVEYLTWLQENSLVTWVRESDSQLGYTLYLAFHTIGMVCLVGPTLLIAARVLGLSPTLPLKPMAAFRPIITIGVWITVITGSVLFACAPVGYVKNVVFVVKIISLVAALFCMRSLLRELFGPSADPDAGPVSTRVKALTWTLLLLWTIGVVAGRLTAYSGVVVIETLKAFFVTIGIALVAGVLWWMRPKRRAEHASTFTIEIQPTPVKGGK